MAALLFAGAVSVTAQEPPEIAPEIEPAVDTAPDPPGGPDEPEQTAPVDSESEGERDPDAAEDDGENAEPEILEAGIEGEVEDDEPDSVLRIAVDAGCLITVDAFSLGEVEAGGTIEHPVDLGVHRIRATSLEFPNAVLDKTVEVADPAGLGVKLRMARKVRTTLRDERQKWTFKNPDLELMWPRRDNGRDVPWRHARSYCEDLKHGGFTEWRLPTLEELDGLKAIWSRAPYKISGGIFLSACCTWSSQREGDRAWNFNFAHKRRFSVPAVYSLGLRALCVHSLEEWVPPAPPAGAEDGDAETESADRPDGEVTPPDGEP